MSPMKALRDRFATRARSLRTITRWMLLFFLSLSAVYLFKGWPLILIAIVGSLVLLRTIDRFPYIGPKWKWLFGDRHLWEWLELLFVPLVLAAVGLQLSSYFTRRQSDYNIHQLRFESTERYLKMFTESDVLAKLKTIPVSEAQTYQPVNWDANPCSVRSSPQGALLSNFTRATLSQLSALRPSSSTPQPQKKIILEYLHRVGAITHGAHSINTKFFDMESSDLYQARLSKACLDSVMFADSAASVRSHSDLRFADLSMADLRGANLAKANLRYANLRGARLDGWASLAGADLRGADLRDTIVTPETITRKAIYNTKKIPVHDVHRNWLFKRICYELAETLHSERWCPDPKDYQVICPTKFPQEFYVDRNVEYESCDVNGTLDEERLKTFGNQCLNGDRCTYMRRQNSVPTLSAGG